MNDIFDVYIRQNLKNWAAKQQPRAYGRSHLLLRASAQYVSRRLAPTARAKREDYYIPDHYPQAEWVFEPISQTRLLLLHLISYPLRNLA